MEKEQGANECMNETQTCTEMRARTTQTRSLDVLASDLARLRPGHPAGQHISNLIGQLQNYERNPVLLKPRILMCIQRIEEARR